MNLLETYKQYIERYRSDNANRLIREHIKDNLKVGRYGFRRDQDIDLETMHKRKALRKEFSILFAEYIKNKEIDNALNLNLAIEVCDYFRLSENRANEIIDEVIHAVSSWKEIATKYGISRVEQELKAIAFKTTK